MRIIPLLIGLLLIAVPVMAIENYCEMRNLVLTHNTTIGMSGNNYTIFTYPPVADQAIMEVKVRGIDGPKQYGSWYTAPFTRTTLIEPAIWRARTNHYVSLQAGTTRVVFEVWNYTSDGTEIGPLWYNAWQTDDINSLSPEEYLTNYARRNGTWLFPGDRLMVKIFANTTSAAQVTVGTTFLGNSNISYIEAGYFECGEGLPVSVPVQPVPISVPIIILAAVGAMALIAAKRGKV